MKREPANTTPRSQADNRLLLLSCCIQGFVLLQQTHHIIAKNMFHQMLDEGIYNAYRELLSADLPSPNFTYHFIIVGAGASGCTLANRLSENPKWSVILLEAGGYENVFHQAPAFAVALQSTHSNWGYKSVPQKRACFGMYNNECALPRGKVLGGTSSINFMIYNRGNRRDYDRWAEAGNKGWSYEEVLPYFLKSENANLANLRDSVYHNHSGPLGVEDVQYRTQIAHAFVKAAEQAGHRRTDYNGESQLGVSYVQSTTRNGRRDSAYRAYLNPIRRKRKNLHIIPFARVSRILLDPMTKSAYGVEFIHRHKKHTITARKEIIISAGTFNSPQLLMLSGIGPCDNLETIGVPLIHELPVGKLMYDHMCHFGPTFLTNTTGQTIFAAKASIIDVERFLFRNDPTTMLSSIGGVEVLTLLKVPKSDEPADMPDIEIITVAGSLASDSGTGLKMGANIKDEIYNQIYRPLEWRGQDHFSVLVMQFHPKSVGRLWLKNSNPLEWPVLDPNYFEVEEDVEIILAGIKEAIRISETPELQRIGTTLLNVPLPGCEQYLFGTDDYWRCSIRTLSYTLHHQVATCRMGLATDPTSVVDPQLKVHGIKRLRVVDTSIIPFPPTAHTNAAAYMIGEKAADMIRADWPDNAAS